MCKIAYHFKGLSVFVPDGIGIVPRELPIPDGIPLHSGEFHVIRIIANIVLVNEEKPLIEEPSEVVIKLPEPVEFRINYKKTDEIQVGNYIRGLKLAYWDTHTWVVISDQAHEYQILPSSTARVAELKSDYWPVDPTLAWGR